MNLIFLGVVILAIGSVVLYLARAKNPQAVRPAPDESAPPGLVERDGQLVPGAPGA